MMYYEFFCLDEGGETHSIGIIPERRKHTERITKESVMQRLRVFLGEEITLNYFIATRVKLDEDTGNIARVTPFSMH